MAGRAQIDDKQARTIGAACLRARRDRTPWKLLERQYNRSRVQLWRYARRGDGKDETPSTTDETLVA